MLMKPHIIILDEPTNHLDIESVEALTTAISNFNGGLVLVSHDARLITEVECELWVCEDGGCYRFEKDFDGYRDKVLHQLDERQAEVERMEQKRRELRAQKRAKHLSEEQLQAAKKRKEQELAAEAAEKARAEAQASQAQEKKDKLQTAQEHHIEIIRNLDFVVVCSDFGHRSLGIIGIESAWPLLDTVLRLWCVFRFVLMQFHLCTSVKTTVEA